MSGRVSDDLLTGQGYAQGTGAPMINLSIGGSQGPLTNPTAWIANAPYVREHAKVVLLEYPKGFDNLPDPDYWKGALKELIETRAIRWEGFRIGESIEYSSNVRYGSAGDIFETAVKASRTRSEPSLASTDAWGASISTFWRNYMNLLIMDPETQKPGILALVDEDLELTPDFSTFSILVIEPNPNGNKVVRAAIYFNMAPKEIEIEMKYDPTNEKEVPEVNIAFTNICEANTAGVRELAQGILDGLNFSGLSPNLRPSFIEEISADVTAVGGGAAGLLDEAARIAIQQ